MSDAQIKPARDLLLKLHWPSEQETSAGTGHVIIELQDASGLAVASMAVSSEQLLRAIARQMDHRPLASLDGMVVVTSDEASLSKLKNQPIALDQLVADAASPEMLEDEPEAIQMLAKFRTRLLKSLELVDQAITSLHRS